MPIIGTQTTPDATRTMHHPACRVFPGAARGARVLGAALLAAALGACDALDRALEVETPSRVPASSLQTPSSAELLVTSAQRDLECAYASYIVGSGLVAGELQDGSQTASRWDYDRRSIRPEQTAYASTSCEGTYGLYTPLNTARFTGDNATTRLEGWTDEEVANRQFLIARAANYAAFALVFLGESFCSASIDVGPELTSEQVFTEAEARFTKALAAAQAAGDDSLANLALLGRAKARLDKGDAAGALADAQLIPPDFVYYATYNAANSRQFNRVFDLNGQGTSVTVAPAYRTLGDPRVMVTDSGRESADQNTRLWVQHKYQSREAPIPLARAAEAQLIIAEVTGAMTPEQVAEERRREFFLEGRRMGDIRRYNLPYDPAPGVPYPAEASSTKGGTYQDLPGKCLPLPDVERGNNPNL
ncbi:MAG TPA: hypothetical protein VHQ45_04360 [Gemmatimonadaceae bacterium]|nr:hypothetical protein [Gemmatimonadaceae bacterium]